MLASGSFLGAWCRCHPETRACGLGGDLLAEVGEVGRHFGHGLGRAQVRNRLDGLQDHLLTVDLLKLVVERPCLLLSPGVRFGALVFFASVTRALLEGGLEALQGL